MGKAMKNETKSVNSVKREGLRSLLRRGAIPDDGEAVKKREAVERSPIRSCLVSTILLKNEPVLRKQSSEDVNERIWMSLVSVFDQTFFKSLRHGANPCGGNSAVELIPSGEREECICAENIKN